MKLLTWLLASAALVSGCVAVLLASGLLRGITTGAFDEGRGMAILVFQAHGALTSAAALVLGGAAWLSARAEGSAMVASRRTALAGLALGALGLLVTLGVALL